MCISLTFAFDPTYASGPTSTSNLPHASIDVDESTNPIITSSIGCSKWKKCIDISINLLSQIHKASLGLNEREKMAIVRRLVKAESIQPLLPQCAKYQGCHFMSL